MSLLRKNFARAAGLILLLGLCSPFTSGYSVLTHEQVVDLMWKDQLQPLLQKRFPNASDEDLLKLSRWLTAAWGFVLIGIAILARSWGSVFTTGLTIASLVYGPMLGAFLLGVLTKRGCRSSSI